MPKATIEKTAKRFDASVLGRRFGRLVVVRFDHVKGYRYGRRHVTQAFVLCRCDCGADHVARVAAMKNGNTRSCGCGHTVHGHAAGKGRAETRTYRVWRSMMKRCCDPKHTNYRWYGGRGIRVCDRWSSFADFLADMGEIPAPMSLDRIDPDEDYRPENCRLADPATQQRNRRPYILESDVKPLVVSPWAARDRLERHGKSGTPTYWSWVSMKSRCQNPKAKSFGSYGGRGIRVCDRWQSFSNFLEDMGERPENTSIDRIDSNGHYCPENCRWASPAEQRNNQRRKIYIKKT